MSESRPSEEQYYTSTERFERLFDRHARQMGLNAAALDEYRDWKREVTATLLELTGIARMESCPLAPERVESVQLDGYVREKWLIQTEPGVRMPFYLLLPDGITEGEKRPAVITPHGHGSGGKYAVAGRRDIPAIAESIERANYDYGVRFVREGYIVACPDARGFGERREWMLQRDDAASLLASTCAPLNHMAISLGYSLTGLWTWDLMRLIDYLETRSDCAPRRIGCAGLSGGGLQTMWLAALDERVSCAVISGYFYGYKEALLQLSNNCACNYVPGLWKYVDMGDIGALIAPRPVLIESGTDDPLNGARGLPNVTEQVEIARHAYRLFGHEDRLVHHVFAGGHRWDGQAAYPFVNQWLRG
jgi:dienelactone hydrolase